MRSLLSPGQQVTGGGEKLRKTLAGTYGLIPLTVPPTERRVLRAGLLSRKI